jgi:hypothetical protein
LNFSSDALPRVLGLLVLLVAWTAVSPGAASAAAPVDGAFEQKTCAQLIEDLRSDKADVAGERLASATCAEIAGSVVATTGKYPFWLGCLGREQMDPRAHAARCLLLVDAVLETTSDSDEGETCDSLKARYRRGLEAATRTGTLPPDSQIPACEVLQTAALIGLGTRPGWMRCRGYDPRRESTHAPICLIGTRELLRLDSCQEVRRVYEERLIAAYGTPPPRYRPLPCFKTTKIVEAAREKIEKMRKAAAAQRAAAASRRRARATPNLPSLEALIGGFLRLRAAAAGALGTFGIQARAGELALRTQEAMRQGLPLTKDRSAGLSDAEKGFFSRDIDTGVDEVVQTELPPHKLSF